MKAPALAIEKSDERAAFGRGNQPFSVPPGFEDYPFFQ